MCIWFNAFCLFTFKQLPSKQFSLFLLCDADNLRSWSLKSIKKVPKVGQEVLFPPTHFGQKQETWTQPSCKNMTSFLPWPVWLTGLEHRPLHQEVVVQFLDAWVEGSISWSSHRRKQLIDVYLSHLSPSVHLSQKQGIWHSVFSGRIWWTSRQYVQHISYCYFLKIT